ncbi:glycosyltransferase [Ruania alkalisoli]|uniref:Glycosyltransferase n=1 Tax=Ruania alkalisoli TaxID=2779775 RepID=A0A7M1SSK0_9MICO|nr:glycosyltransferase [Ruania alkalisoli]QOR69772.1 glycosyltransferase [Ruania alkalisoli]
MQRHLLYVAWGFPPCRGGGVYRALATANEFARAGWRVTVLTANRETFELYTGADESLEAEIDPRVEVVRIPFVWPAQEPDIRSYSRLRVHLPQLWSRCRSLLDQLPFPERGYGPWRRPLVAAAHRIHERDPVDLVVATANPYVTFAAATALHERGVPYALDFRDAWSLDVFSGRTVAGRRSRIGRVERRSVAGAIEVWFVNEPIRKWYATRYPEHSGRMHVVANGWDPGLVAGGTGHAAEARSGAPPTFGYLGTITRKVPLEVLVQGWALAKERGDLPSDARLRLAGYLGYFAGGDTDLRAVIARGADSDVEFVGAVPKRDVARFYDGVDVLVLALGAGAYVTSGKVFEYLAIGRPIVSVHAPQNAVADVLTGHPLWAPVDEVDAASVASALGVGWRFARSATPKQLARARDFGMRYRRDRQLVPRIRALREALAARSPS